MTRRYWPLILTLASLWGASYFLIKVGVDGGFSPAALMAARALLAAVVLLGYLATTIGLGRAIDEIRAAWRACVVLGAINAAIPFWLVAWGETRIDSGIAAIAQATVPLFSLLIGLRFLPQEHISRLRIAGVGLGIVGVALIAGVAPAGDLGEVVGTFAVILASFFYASAGIYGQLRLRGTTSGPVLATGNMLAAGLILLPFAIVQRPESMPTTGALGSLVLLAVLPTALAQLILFRTIALFGARRLSLVTYLMPGIALFYGAVLLGEQVTIAAIAGLVLILLGVALGSGTLRPGRRAAEAARRRAAGRGLEENPKGRLRRAAATHELRCLVQVDGAVEREDERGVTVEPDRDQLLHAPAQHPGRRIGSAFDDGLDRRCLERLVAAHAALHSLVTLRFCSST